MTELQDSGTDLDVAVFDAQIKTLFEGSSSNNIELDIPNLIHIRNKQHGGTHMSTDNPNSY